MRGRTVRVNVLLGIVWVASMIPVSAHHSHGNYGPDWTPLQGTVTEVHYLVPHSWIYLEVKDAKGELVTWAMEAAAAPSLERVKIGRNVVRPGDLVKATCRTLRAGTAGCLLGTVTPLHGDTTRGHGVERNWDAAENANNPAP